MAKSKKKVSVSKASAKKVDKIKYPTKYTFNSMVEAVAAKNELSKKQVRTIAEDLYDVIRAGVMSGARIPVGNIGKMFVRVRPATKTRMGRNPFTGAEIQIKAKPAISVPKFGFSKGFKENVRALKPKK